MARREIWLRKTAALVAVLTAVACGGGGDAGSEADADTAATAEQESAPPQQEGATQQAQAAQSGSMVLTATDLDGYRKGMQAEIADVKKKIAALGAAKSGTDSLEALGALTNEADRVQAGADAAGMPLAQFQQVASAVNNVLGAYSIAQMMRKSQAGVDTASLSEEARARVRENMVQAEAGLKRLPQQNVDLVVPHAAELDSLRLLPAALALKAASGM